MDILLVFVLPFLGMLAVLVVIHELGHFITAKLFGIRVEEFGLGFPPRIKGFRFGDTIYSINWLLPLGGFVRLEGENEDAGPRSFAAKGTGTRFLVLVAGPLMNVVLPIFIFTVFFMVPQDVLVGNVVVTGVAPDSPAARAGIESGDTIESANGRKIEHIQDLTEAILFNLGSEMEWQVRLGLGVDTVHVVPRWNPPEGQGWTGIEIGMTDTTVVTRSEPLWRAVPHAVTRIRDLLILIKNEITSWLVVGGTPQLAGPIGIAQVTGEVARDGGLVSVIGLAAIISISLAILNILPIPALDGGRLVFVIVEWARRGKRISPKREGLVHLIGFATLMALLVVVTYFDILRLVEGQSLVQ